MERNNIYPSIGAWDFVFYWCEPPINLNNGFGGGPYLFLPASPGRQPKKISHKKVMRPRKPDKPGLGTSPRIQNGIANIATMIVHDSGRFRSWWRLKLTAKNIHKQQINDSAIGIHSRLPFFQIFKFVMYSSHNRNDGNEQMLTPNHHCFLVIRPRKLKRRYMIAFTNQPSLFFSIIVSGMQAELRLEPFSYVYISFSFEFVEFICKGIDAEHVGSVVC